MNATTRLHALGQSLWLDNITRDLLTSGTLERYRTELCITGLTSNLAAFDQAIRDTAVYDDAIGWKIRQGMPCETLFFELAMEDLTRAATLFRLVHEASHGMEGWVSLEVSPLLADDVAGTIDTARWLHTSAQCNNLFIKIPGTAAGIQAAEELIFAGVPINITLLFSRGHYIAAAGAYARGIRRRVYAGLDPKVHCVASIFVSRWDQAVKDMIPPALRNRLGIAVARQIYKTYRERLIAPQWRELARNGALPQRLVWASTGTRDPTLRSGYYVEALAAPHTINTLPGKTMLEFAERGEVRGAMRDDGGDSESLLAEFAQAGVGIPALAAQLQDEGRLSFIRSWNKLMNLIAAKGKPT
ncbi:transaldolase [Bordetella sp. FB-8]|uniref:transaldolase n=1 Tax=Bordetella sp. FB-8 TaxID=1159870 RepID=UPI000371FE0D|nr:transaldolase [Bordetella sp. FB-8]